MIKAKCDAEVCDSTKMLVDNNKETIDTLIATLEELQETVDAIGDIDLSQYQLIANMIDSLDGDLEGKYPSAALLKEELIKLWKCVYTRHKHYGLWEDNFIIQDTTTPEAECLIEDNNLPTTQKVQIPIDIGDTVIGADGCIYESLRDNNTVKPTPAAVYDGIYRSNCLELDVLNCVIPENGDTICQRVTALEGNTPVDSNTFITDFTYNEDTKQYVIARSDGTYFSAKCCSNPIFATVKIPAQSTTDETAVLEGSITIEEEGLYEVNSQAFVLKDCECITTHIAHKHRILVDGVSTDMGYFGSNDQLYQTPTDSVGSLVSTGSQVLWLSAGAVLTMEVYTVSEGSEHSTKTYGSEGASYITAVKIGG